MKSIKRFLHVKIILLMFLALTSKLYAQKPNIQNGYSSGSVKGVSNPDHAQEARSRKKEALAHQAMNDIAQDKNLKSAEEILLKLRDDADFALGSVQMFNEFYYFSLAVCQEKQDKKRLALESYRSMYSSHGADHGRERYMGLYALCALDCGYTNEARIAVQECIDKMREDTAYVGEYEYITDVPVTSNVNIIRAHVYLLLSRGINQWTSACGWTDNGGPKTQEYLKKAIELGRNSTPNAYLKMAEYTRWSDPSQSRKYLEAVIKLYKAFPMHAQKAKEMLKEFPPPATR